MTNAQWFVVIETTLCLMPGLLLRYIPFRGLLDKRQKKILFLSYVLLVLGNSLLFAAAHMFLIEDIANASWLSKLDYTIFGIAGLGVNMFLIKGHAREHIYTYGVVATCNYILLQMSTFIAVHVPNLDATGALLVGSVLFILMLLGGYFPISFLLKRTVEPFLNMESRDYWKWVWFIPVVMYYSMFFSQSPEENISTVYQLVSRILVSFATVFLTYIVAENHKMLMEKQVMSEQLERSKVHYIGLQGKMEQARKSRHDMKHLISAIRHYIDTDDKSGLREFCNDLEIENESHANIPYTGNAPVDGVLYHYMMRSEKQQVQFQYKGSIQSEGITDMDICVLLGNALENAMTGCLTREENRRITIISQKEGCLLSIAVQNTFDGKVETREDMLLSRKRKNVTAGIGISSMKGICEKYGGTMELSWEEDTFTVLFLLPTVESEK